MNRNSKIVLTSVVAGVVGGLLVGSVAQAATWVGGSGDWVSSENNWGLGAGVYPGDAAHPTEVVTINSGTVAIKPGNTVTLTASPGLITVAAGAAINQTGGTLNSKIRTTLYGGYNISGGLLEPGASTVRPNRGGSLNLSGAGQIGTRSTNVTNNSQVDFNGNGNGTFDITGGTVDVHSIIMYNLTTNASYTTADAVVQVTGNTASLNTLFWYLKSSTSSAAATATAKFVFSASGISTWNLTGGGAGNGNLDLGTGTSRGRLYADVAAITSDGTTGYKLINYRNSIIGDGTFGSVTIVDDHFGTMTPGTQGNLQPGQFFLAMNGGDGSDVVLFFNNQVPEPASLGLMSAATLLLGRRRRR